jgi:CBS domain-containing protein
MVLQWKPGCKGARALSCETLATRLLVTTLEVSMPTGDVCIRDVIVTGRETTILEAARLMRTHHVGNVIIIDKKDNVTKPVGILTDRDIVIEVVAAALEPASLTVGAVMGQELVTASEEQGVFETIQQMRLKGIRRIPIVDKQGGLIGVVSVDDLIEMIADELGGIAELMQRERKHEAQTRP